MQLTQPVLRLPEASAGGARGGSPPLPWGGGGRWLGKIFFKYNALRLILEPINGSMEIIEWLPIGVEM